ncbi:MAG: hypothetical protein Fur0021_02690 [Candidatus Promineifilaceae bacterium]
MESNRRLVRVASLLGLAFALVVWGEWLPALRGPSEWHWWQAPAPPTSRVLLFTAAAVLFGLGWWALGRWLAHGTRPSRLWLALTGLFCLVTLLQIALLALSRPHPLALQFEYVVSNQVSGYWTAAQELGPIETALTHYPERMRAFTADPHPRSKPPGIVLIFWGVQQALALFPEVSQPIGQWARAIRCGDLWLAAQPDAALAAAVMMGVLTPLLSALALWPAYGLAARRWGSATGWLAAGLVAIVPGRLLFTPNFDTIYLTLTLLALYWLDTGLRRSRLGWTFAAGVVLSVETFFSLVTGMAGLVAGFFMLLTCLPQKQWRPLLRHAIALGLGSLTIWALYELFFGVSPLEIYHAAAPARNDLRRSYALWLGWNLVDFALFVGVPVFLLAFPWTTPGKQRAWLPLALAFWITLLGFNASGQIRAEVGRIWLIIAGIPPILTAARAAQDEHGRLWLLTSLLSITWALGLRWEVNPLEWPPPQPHNAVAALPPLTHPLTVSFGPEITLHGYDLAVDETLTLTLYWTAQAQPQLAYTVFVHLLGADGQIARQQDVMPQNGLLPTTCWQAGEVIVDEHKLSLAGMPAGNYSIRLGLYYQPDNKPLGAPIILQSVMIPPAP